MPHNELVTRNTDLLNEIAYRICQLKRLFNTALHKRFIFSLKRISDEQMKFFEMQHIVYKFVGNQTHSRWFMRPAIHKGTLIGQRYKQMQADIFYEF